MDGAIAEGNRGTFSDGDGEASLLPTALSGKSGTGGVAEREIEKEERCDVDAVRLRAFGRTLSTVGLESPGTRFP